MHAAVPINIVCRATRKPYSDTRVSTLFISAPNAINGDSRDCAENNPTDGGQHRISKADNCRETCYGCRAKSVIINWRDFLKPVYRGNVGHRTPETIPPAESSVVRPYKTETFEASLN